VLLDEASRRRTKSDDQIGRSLRVERPEIFNKLFGSFVCRYFECDGPDPLKTEMVTGWLKGELQPPR
jgi:hypothetical protein